EPGGISTGATMLGMIKRWLRRRLTSRADEEEPDSGDEDRERGELVRKGRLVTLRTHVPANREAFQRWYADPEIAELLRHDLEPLTSWQSRGYFDSFILPSSARGTCFAIHERKTKRLIGTTALTDRISGSDGVSALFRIVIGEKDLWGRGYGTEATRLVVEEAFDAMGLSAVRLEVFRHNARAIGAYERVGFEMTGEHTEWVSRKKTELRVMEMRLTRDAYYATGEAGQSPAATVSDRAREKRRERRQERQAARAMRRDQRADRAGVATEETPQAEPGPHSAVD
ncbi:MAG: acetyltransferase, ribosomal protein N-acetylase, partial [Thermomicrobiales bacterium]|nr:acetyltransferase, ribosomal protein N-acetylase [Thermomicrobiales bacterium]